MDSDLDDDEFETSVEETKKSTIQVPETQQKKRGRKKKYVIESLKKLKSNDKEHDKVEFDIHDSNNNNSANSDKKTLVSFGSLNITIHKKEPECSTKIRKFFDEKFELNDTEKVPSVLIQDDTSFNDPTTNEDTSRIQNHKQVNDVHNTISQINNGTFTSGSSLLNNNFKILDSTWPTKTNVYCYWCCHPFDNQPLPCPISYNDITNKFNVTGNFCSWGCVSAYSIDRYKSLTYVYLMYKKILNESGNDDKDNETTLPIALPKYTLKIFGGNMNIDEFRSHNLKTKNVIISNKIVNVVNNYIIEV